jgi:hypothetical protein
MTGLSQQSVVAVEWGIFTAPPPAILEHLALHLLKSQGFSPSLQNVKKVADNLHVLWLRWCKTERQAHASLLAPLFTEEGGDIPIYRSYVEWRTATEPNIYRFARLVVYDQRALQTYEETGGRKKAVFSILADMLPPVSLQALSDLPFALLAI